MHATRTRRWVCITVLVSYGTGLVPIPAAASTRPQETVKQTENVTQTAAPEQPAPRVVVNRTVPRVTPPPLMPTFSARVTDAEIAHARVFAEPLMPIGGTTSAEENAALAAALSQYLRAGQPETTGPIDAFLRRFPESPWRASLLTNLGIVLRRTGYISRALVLWEQAWSLTKAATDRPTRQLADRALGELFELNARLGRYEVLEQLFAEIEGRDVIGSATEQISGARQALWMMRNRPGEAFRCGPLALDQILRATRAGYQFDARVMDFPSTIKGTSLLQMQTLAGQVGLDLQMARRVDPQAAVLTPAVVHWRAGHFAALIREGGGRILVRDATFGEDLWITRAALAQEASGYFLVPAGSLPAGWQPVSEQDGGDIWGRGMNTGNDPQHTRQCDRTSTGSCGSAPCPGMAGYRFHLMVISLNLRDTPVGYAPPRGPEPRFTVTYNQRDAFQPQTFSYANLGPKWTFDWLSYIEDDPTNVAAPVGLYLRGGGYETHTGYNSATQSYAPHPADQAIVVRTSTSPVRYERRFSDGSTEIFAQPDGTATYPRRVFMTAWTDPQGNTLSFTYDASLRLVAATDAIGQVTTLAYEAGDPLKITKVTDPFGRFATFAYDSSGRLSQITDVIGLSSSFTYGQNDFVSALTTPYGTTRFTKGERDVNRWLEAVDPLGGRERAEYGGWTILSEPTAEVPTGMNAFNLLLSHSNTHYWDKRAMALAPGDRNVALNLHWAIANNGQFQASGVADHERKALERRVWYNYPGQGQSNYEGTMEKPTVIGRVLDDGTTQLWKSTYNSRGKLTKATDPVGRETTYVYAANDIDLLEIRQTTGGMNDLLQRYGDYNAQHLPQTMIDAAGQPTTLTYNSAGQKLTVTNAKNETTTYAYNANGFLQTVTGPISSATTTYTYDDYGRVHTVTDSDGYAITKEYDAADRPTRITYPNGTYEQTMYDRLDPVQRRDRLGRWTHMTYDALRRPVSVRDPLGRVTTQQWCTCGSLDAVLDGKGQSTMWERDIRGRIAREVRPDGVTATSYTYEPTTGRLKTVVDPKGQITTYAYNVDDTIQSLMYTNSAVATSAVSYAYDTDYQRLTRMTDGTGMTTYAYKPVGTLGALQMATEDGPLSNDTTTYEYDELSRVTTRVINGAANQTTRTYDALGRVVTEVNALGTFTFVYDGATSRLALVTYPNGQTSAYSYADDLGDHRLQTIHYKYPNSATLSRFDYTYDAVGNIVTLRQQADSDPPVEWRYSYNAADQLLIAEMRSTGTAPTV